jgi:hypothetical protein
MALRTVKMMFTLENGLQKGTVFTWDEDNDSAVIQGLINAGVAQVIDEDEPQDSADEPAPPARKKSKE